MKYGWVVLRVKGVVECIEKNKLFNSDVLLLTAVLYIIDHFTDYL